MHLAGRYAKVVQRPDRCVRNQLGDDPQTGHLFVFLNKPDTLIKILYWDGEGFAIWFKKLEAEGIPIFVFTRVGG